MIVPFEKATLAPLCEAAFRANPQVRFNRARLKMAKGWTLVDLKIGNMSQSANLGESSDIYDGDGCDLGQIDNFHPGMVVTLTVRNDTNGAAVFGGALFVSYDDPPPHFRPVTIRVTEEGVMVLP